METATVWMAMLCRCERMRMMMFAVRSDEKYVLPGVDVRHSESLNGAFDRFVSEHFGLSVDAFDPNFRTLRWLDGSFRHFAFCSIDRLVGPPAGPGAGVRFIWIRRQDMQRPERFADETRGVLEHPDIRQALFDVLTPVS